VDEGTHLVEKRVILKNELSLPFGISSSLVEGYN